jgi:ATP-dependent exoDNAse (exonuclease V) beta subunit
MGVESVPFRPRTAKLQRPPVVPGLHRPELGKHKVVWWDPSLLRLGVRESVGLTQQKLLTIDEDGRRSEASIAAHAGWQANRARIRDEAASPLMKVETATASAEKLGGVAETESSDVRVESAGQFVRRPHGDRFGVLVHAMLAVVDLAADRSDVESAAELQGRLHNATPEEMAAAVDVVASALNHPLLKRAAGAAARGRCRRESSIGVTLEDGTIVEGVLDLAFLDVTDRGEEWIVIDFKTDLEIGDRIEKYKRQVALYAHAVSRASGAVARGVLMKLR